MSEQILDIVDRAERVIQNLQERSKGKFEVTSSQLRKFLSVVTTLKNKVELANNRVGIHERKLSPELALEVKFLKANLLYQIGREKDTFNSMKMFVDESKLIKDIECIGTDYKRFQEFCKYMEALVAFHKYYLAIKDESKRR